jgi:hypothetical protein
MIPPLTPIIIVGALSGISVGKMFLAGAIPCILMGALMRITANVIAVRKGFPRQPWQGGGEAGCSFLGAFRAIAMTALIVGGLMYGLATPTQTAIATSVYALIVGAFVYRGLSLRAAPKIGVDSAAASASILAPVGFANLFGWILVSERIAQAIAEAALSVTDTKLLVILPINVLPPFVGMFRETIAALIILLAPLLALAQGVDPPHFAAFAVLTLMIELTTPPGDVPLGLRQHRRAAADPGGVGDRAVPRRQCRGAAGVLCAGDRDVACIGLDAMSRSMGARIRRLQAAHDIRIETPDLSAPDPGEAPMALGAGGICGPDLPYFHNAGFGAVRVREPILPGHQSAGAVRALGSKITGPVVDDKVALNPSTL